jgi:hypothetical protein
MTLNWRQWLGLETSMQEFARLLTKEFAKHGSTGWKFDPSDGTLKLQGESTVNLATSIANT